MKVKVESKFGDELRVSEELEELVKKPMREWSQEERSLFGQQVSELNSQGGVVILPLDRCCRCGAGLSNKVFSASQLDECKVGFVMPLCEECKDERKELDVKTPF